MTLDNDFSSESVILYMIVAMGKEIIFLNIISKLRLKLYRY